MSDEDWMRVAIQAAEEAIAAGQTPFGACIVKAGQLIAAAHNRVWADTDATAHAEIVAIRQACRNLNSIDLSGCTIYSTCEPCPMCFSACHWARLDRIVYGTDIESPRSIGFNELTISNEHMKQQGASPIQITPGVLREQCAQLFRTWATKGNHRTY